MRESTGGDASRLVVLYSREECCLCDDALREIEAARATVPFRLRVVDVDGDPELARRYGHEVPVVEIDGRKAFKYRVTSRELLRRLRRAS
ncbi:MAG: glutaredoxin family protein [Thermodesulfobacteriota bacterium]